VHRYPIESNKHDVADRAHARYADGHEMAILNATKLQRSVRSISS